LVLLNLCGVFYFGLINAELSVKYNHRTCPQLYSIRCQVFKTPSIQWRKQIFWHWRTAIAPAFSSNKRSNPAQPLF